MKWNLHDKWAGKLGIDEEISQGINSLIDDIGEEDLVTEFQQLKREYESKVLDRKDVAKGNSAIGAVVALHDDEHDAGRKLTTDSKIYSEIQLEFLKDKGEGHVRAWYLHHHLDYLDEMWEMGKSVERLQTEYREKYPQAFSEEIFRFLNGHAKELSEDLSN